MDVNMGNVLGLVFANMHDTTLGDLTGVCNVRRKIPPYRLPTV